MKPETCYWDDTQHKLVGSQRNKVRRYLRENLIHPAPSGYYFVEPYEGLHLRHTVDPFLWTCTCQHNSRTGKECSHTLAVRLYLQQIQDGGREENVKSEEPSEDIIRFGEET